MKTPSVLSHPRRTVKQIDTACDLRAELSKITARFYHGGSHANAAGERNALQAAIARRALAAARAWLKSNGG